MSLRLRWLAFAALLGTTSIAQAQTSAAGAAGAGKDAASLVSRADEQWPSRDQPGVIDQIRSELEQAHKLAPDDYGVLWRLARLDFWVSDDPALPDGDRSRLGKQAWDLGDRAAAANPGGVEGWYFAALGMGNYSLGIGILKALGEGIEGKFKERLSKAEKIDPTYQGGGIYSAWGRFYFKLPWPKYDAKRSEQNLRKALQINPANVRGRLFLAELYKKEGHPKEARKLLEEAVAHEPGLYDAPEERRSQKQVRELLAEMKH
jgi:tetratricopeptide (TPR) repeat protein